MQNPHSPDDEHTCPWCVATPLYREYHDTEWGRPCLDSEALFQMLCLEGAQAGLSWITILNKRAHYQKVFYDFQPEKVARMTDSRIEKLVLDPGIVRHRGKIESVRSNAKIYLAMAEQGEDFAHYIWSFVDHKPKRNRPISMDTVPSKTDISDAMCASLKKRGFKFVGSTICYAFMQAAGLVNDHLVTCKQEKQCADEANRLF